MESFKSWMNEEKNNKSDDAYEVFFQKQLNKWGIDSPEELSDKEKKKFFDYVDKNWKADNEDKASD